MTRKSVSWLDRPIKPIRRGKIRPWKRVLRPPVDGLVEAAGQPKPPLPRPPKPPPPPPPPKAKRKQSEIIIRWIEERCYVPEGRLLGNKFKLAAWQKECIEDVYDNPVGTRRAILSFGRKNGKTTLAALLLLVHLCGPKHRINGQLYSAASSREQAALIFAMAAKIVRMSPDLRGALLIREATKELRCPELGTRYRALSAEASTAFGLNPVFMVHDELGQVRGPRSELYEALETATGAQDDPLSIVISTQAPSDQDLLSILIDDAMTGVDKRVVCKLFCAPMTDDPFAVDTILKANPAFANFLNDREVLAMAEDARRMPAREAEFRNLVLNQRVEASNPFVKPAQWKACGDPVVPLDQCEELYAGLDLSEVIDLTALVIIGKSHGQWHVHPTFWLPAEGLYERARTDHVPYDRWYEDGFLRTTPGASVHYDYVAQHVRELFSKIVVNKIGFDRWNFRHFKPCLIRAGFSEQELEERWVEFGQGTQSMSPALRELEQMIVNRELRHGMHPVLNMCASHAVVDSTDASNRKLSKKKSSGRIDGMVALAMAVGVKPLGTVVDVSTLVA